MSKIESKNKEETKKEVIETALHYFKNGSHCSESVLKAYQESLDFDKVKEDLERLEPMMPKMAHAFGGGIGGSGGVCGTLTMSVLVLSLAYGREDIPPIESKEYKEKARYLAQELLKRFEEKNESINCRELTNLDVSTPEKAEEASEAGIKDICESYEKDAIDITIDLLFEPDSVEIPEKDEE